MPRGAYALGYGCDTYPITSLHALHVRLFLFSKFVYHVDLGFKSILVG